ncbi:hypothetical protein C8Q76DRAFT_661420 [Earliella scabrosa]|nr:hypothetical protein C8Q76DRAFT_661420 [Earliella scabrosa]
MSTVFAVVHRAVRPALARHASRPCASLLRPRSIHVSPVVLKKKQQNAAASEPDELFSDLNESDSDDLFGGANPSASTPASTTSSPSPSSEHVPPHNPSVPPPPSVGKEKRFEEVYAFLKAYLVDNTETKRVPRTSVWINLLQVTATRDQLTRLVELMPKWRDFKREFPPSTAAQFAKRCERLRSPELALAVFSDRPKYGLDLDMDAAQITLHGLQARRSVQECITFTSLFSVYNLPPVTSDLYCTAFLLRALFKDGSEESLTVARTMVPSLKQLLESSDPQAMSLANRTHRPHEGKHKRRLARTLKTLGSSLDEHGIEHAWLDTFMDRSGYNAV